MDPVLVVIIAVAWPIVGLLAGLWLARRGYSPLWTLIALPLGPMFIPIALERARRRPKVAEYGAGGAPPPRPPGTTEPRVLVGLDGSDDSRRALATALKLLGPRCGLLVLAEVVAYDAADESTRAEVGAASARLAELAAGLDTSAEVHTEVLTGPPAEALRRLAEDQEIDLLVVGRRGRGISTRLMGRISADLVENSQVPVLVCEPSGDRT